MGEHITKNAIRVLLSSAKWILPISISFNGVNIMKVTRAVGFMKPCEALKIFAIDIA